MPMHHGKGIKKNKKNKKNIVCEWQPSSEDAINLAALRIYALTIESLSLLIYRTDPHVSRPNFAKIQRVLGTSVKALRKLADESGDSPKMMFRGRCPDNDVLCDDGLCHPPDECS